MPLFLLGSTVRERSFTKAPALSNIGSMSQARLSLSTVASPHCRLLFHLAAGILAEHQRRLSGQFRTKRLSSLTGGLEVKQQFYASGLGRNIFLTFPFIDQAIALFNPEENIFPEGRKVKSRYFANCPWDRCWCTFSDSVKLWMIPVGALVIALYLWTPKTGKGIAIYGAIVLAMLIIYFALRG